jgi:Skp family chaperone for outer membrane proteins
MKKVILVVALAALLAPLAALADASPSPAQTANQLCAAEKAQMGADTFKQTYGTNPNKANAWGKCVSGKAKSAHATTDNAAQAGKAEQAQGQAAFTAKYGTNKNDKNAFGKCVSGKVQTAVSADAKKAANAAKTCKAMLKSNAADFATKYGKKANAFGKCVAAKGK